MDVLANSSLFMHKAPLKLDATQNGDADTIEQGQSADHGHDQNQ